LANLLNVKHHHVVFTLPKPLRHIRNRNSKIILDLLFNASAQALKEWFLKRHNIIPGIVSILHTAGSDLKDHPHIHMIVTAGGLSNEDFSVAKLNSEFLTRQRFLANKFKTIFSKSLLDLYNLKKLNLHKSKIEDPIKFKQFINNIKQKQWIVSIQKPLEDLNQIVGYVGRYTKRTCISEYKISSIKGQFISFQFNDYKNTPRGQKPIVATKTMHYVQFLDQLLFHVPDKSFRMVRYFGAYNSNYKKYLPLNEAKIQFEKTHTDESFWSDFAAVRLLDIQNGKPDPLLCPQCKTYLTDHEVFFPFKTFINDS